MKFCPSCGREYESGDVCEVDGLALIQPQPSAADQLIGRVFKDSYRLEQKIGEGGMGIVFRGTQIALERAVAVKVLLPGYHSSATMVQRFFREARLLSQLNHPNVVSIIDFGHSDDGMVYMVMEMLDGATLHDVVPAGARLGAGRVVTLMQQVCLGVAAAHRQGLVHRDLKPDNIFVVGPTGPEEVVKILDFGIALPLERGDQTQLTRAGQLVGTPGFLAPEQIAGRSADERSDIYALGAILYFLVTGQRPFGADTPHAIFARQLHESPKLEAASLGEHQPLAKIVSRALLVEPENRYQSAQEMKRELEETAATAGLIELSISTPVTVAPPAAALSTAATKLLDRKKDQAKPDRHWLPLIALCFSALVLIVLIGSRLFPELGRPKSSDRVSSVPGISEDRISVGMSAAFSGPSRELGRGMQLGVQISLRDLADRGGVHGRTVELIALDDGYEPSRTVANMAELLLEREVFAILGNVGTPTAEVALPLSLEQQRPFFGAFSGADLLRKDPPDRTVFNFRASYAQETAAIVEYLLDVRGIRPAEIAVFAQQDAYGDTGFQGVAATLEARGFDGTIPRLGYRRNTTDVDDAVERLGTQYSSVRALVLVATYRAAAKFIRRTKDELELRDREMVFASLSFVGSRAFAEELTDHGEQYAEGVVVTQVVPHVDSNLPGVRRYRELLTKYFPAEQPSFVSLEGFLATEVFVAGLQAAGRDITLDGFVDGVESIRDMDLGIGVPVRFSADRHQGSEGVWGTVLDRRGNYQELDLSQ